MCAFWISSVGSLNAPNVLSANINMRPWVYSHLSPSKKRRLFVRKTC